MPTSAASFPHSGCSVGALQYPIAALNGLLAYLQRQSFLTAFQVVWRSVLMGKEMLEALGSKQSCISERKSYM